MKIERIQQKGANDCGIAAIAMACDVPYDIVLPLMQRGSGAGINEIDLQDWLRENGWAWQIVYKNRRIAGRYQERDPWPPAPWAPSHIAQVVTPTAYHFAVMDENGEVFDSWTPSRKTLADLDYREVSWVMGLWKVRDAEQRLRDHQS